MVLNSILYQEYRIFLHTRYTINSSRYAAVISFSKTRGNKMVTLTRCIYKCRISFWQKYQRRNVQTIPANGKKECVP